MKILYFLVFLLILISNINQSCSKKNPVTIGLDTTSLVGKWKWTQYGDGVNFYTPPDSLIYYLDFRSNGTLISSEKPVYCDTGTYKFDPINNLIVTFPCQNNPGNKLLSANFSNGKVTLYYLGVELQKQVVFTKLK